MPIMIRSHESGICLAFADDDNWRRKVLIDWLKDMRLKD
jgi:hypothetical protein